MRERIELAERHFEDQSAMLSELGSGFRALALDLEFAVRWFPVILGALFAWITLSLSHRLQVYKRTSELLGEKDGTFLALLVPIALNPLGSRRRLRGDTLLRGGLACAWIALCTGQLALWDEISAHQVRLMAALALGLVIVSQWVRYRDLRGLVDVTD